MRMLKHMLLGVSFYVSKVFKFVTLGNLWVCNMVSQRFVWSVFETYVLLSKFREGICISELALLRGLSRKQVYLHLKFLERLGLVVRERHGYRVYVRVKPGLDYTDFLRVVKEYKPFTVIEAVRRVFRQLIEVLGTSKVVLTGAHLITYPYEPFVMTQAYEFLIPYEYFRIEEIRKVEVKLSNVKLIPAPSRLIEERTYRDGIPLPKNPLKAYIYTRQLQPGGTYEIAVSVLYTWSNFKHLNNPIINAFKALVAFSLGQDWKKFAEKIPPQETPILLKYALIHNAESRYIQVLKELSNKGIVVFLDTRILETFINKICFGRACKVE